MDFLSNNLATNRSIPVSRVIPVLVYDDVAQAVDWLCNTFGFIERLRIGNHRSQLVFGDGAVIVSEQRANQELTSSHLPRSVENRHSLMVRIEDVDRHYELARERGAQILHPPTTYPYGERQYTAEDLGGHQWTFSQSMADVDPEEWGGKIVSH